MKKKMRTLLLAFGCALSVTACGSADTAAPATESAQETVLPETDVASEGEESAANNEEAPEAESVTQTAAAEETIPGETKKEPAAGETELSDDLYAYQVSIDGTVYQFPMWYSDFESYGWTYDGDPAQTLDANQYTSGEVWKKDGVCVYTEIANLSINTAPFSECIVAGITLERYDMEDTDWEILLPGGIEWGVSDADDIIAAYGDPTDTYDGDLYYKMTYEQDYYNSVSLYVFKEDNSLKEIHIENMVELEGTDDSVDMTVPDAVKNYEVPAALSDDFYDYTAQLEGVVYSLPCPVSVLLENGFTINEKGSDSVVPSHSFGWVELTYNNRSYRTIADNYADYATCMENCFVTTMTASVNDPQFDLVFPGGITLGTGEADVIKAVEGFHSEVKTSDSGYTYYTVSDPDADVTNEYTITVKDQKVISMEIENSMD